MQPISLHFSTCRSVMRVLPSRSGSRLTNSFHLLDPAPLEARHPEVIRADEAVTLQLECYYTAKSHIYSSERNKRAVRKCLQIAADARPISTRSPNLRAGSSSNGRSSWSRRGVLIIQHSRGSEGGRRGGSVVTRVCGLHGPEAAGSSPGVWRQNTT